MDEKNQERIDRLKREHIDAFKQIGIYILTLFKWIFIGCFIGTVVGLVCVSFSYGLSFVTEFRETHPWMLYLLPVSGLVIVFLYYITKNMNDRGTNTVIDFFHSENGISYKMAPLIYISSLLTHLCGGSAGREGAAIQIGGSIGNTLSKIKWLHFTPKDRRAATRCGMCAGFSALFGTPLAATVFSLEVINVGHMPYSVMVPCAIASYIASFWAKYFGLKAETFHVRKIPAFTVVNMGKMLIFGACLGIISILFCVCMHQAKHIYQRFFKSPYMRIFVAGLLIVILTMLLGTDMYLGSGMGIIEEIFHENEPVVFYAFLLKLIFTAITIGAGYKGGEIVPALCIGAAFGSCASVVMGLPLTLIAACGMVGVFCGTTNCPLTALLLGFEMFGFAGTPFYFMTIAVSYMLSGYFSLYQTQHISYSKLENTIIDGRGR